MQGKPGRVCVSPDGPSRDTGVGLMLREAHWELWKAAVARYGPPGMGGIPSAILLLRDVIVVPWLQARAAELAPEPQRDSTRDVTNSESGPTTVPDNEKGE